MSRQSPTGISVRDGGEEVKASPGPAIAVINLPGLAEVLRRGGFNVLGAADAGPKEIADLVRPLKQNNETYVIILGIDDPQLRPWVTLQASMGVPVLVANAERFSNGAGIPKSKSFDLPATVREIMDNFGAPPFAGDEVIIDAEGNTPRSPNDDNNSVDEIETDEEPQFEVFGSTDVKHTEAEDVLVDAPAPGTTSVFNAPPVVALTPPTSVFASPPQTDDGSATPPFPSVDTFIREPPSVASRIETAFTAPARVRPKSERLAKVIIVFAGKGGVGKSTTAGALAERAPTMVPNLRSVVIDNNRGQGDLRTYLDISDAPLPSIYDAAVSRSAEAYTDAIINPKRLAAHRINKPPLHFGIILAPSRDQSDPYIVNSDVYAKAIQHARVRADLVIVDTQTIESYDTSGIIDDVVVPLLLDGAWGLGVSDSSRAGADNLWYVLANFVARGVAPNRLMTMMNRVAPETAIDTEVMSKFVNQYSTWMGVAYSDFTIEAITNRAEIPGAKTSEPTPEYTAILDKVLHRVTGIAAFAPTQTVINRETSRRGKWMGKVRR